MPKSHKYQEMLSVVEKRTGRTPYPTYLVRVFGADRGMGNPRPYTNHDIEKIVLSMRLRQLGWADDQRFFDAMPTIHAPGWMVGVPNQTFFTPETPTRYLKQGMVAVPIHKDCTCLKR